MAIMGGMRYGWAILAVFLVVACDPVWPDGGADAGVPSDDAAVVYDAGAAGVANRPSAECEAAPRDPVVGEDPYCPSVAEWLSAVEPGARSGELAKCRGLWERCGVTYAAGPDNQPCFWCPFTARSPHYR